MRTVLLRRAKMLRKLSDNISASEKLYILGLLTLVNALFTGLFSREYALYLAAAGVIIFASGVVAEGLSIAKVIWKNSYGKVFISLLIAAGSTFSVAISSVVVAFITSSDPSLFPYTVAMLGFLLIPMHAWLILIAFAFIAFLIQFSLIPVLWMINRVRATPIYRYAVRKKDKPRKERFFWISMIARAVALGFLVSTLQFLSNFEKNYSSFVYQRASNFLFSYEMFPRSHCTKLHDGERFSYISTDVVLVARKSENHYLFETRPCHQTQKSSP